MKQTALTVRQRTQLATLPVTLIVVAISCIWLGANVPPSRVLLIEAAFAVLVAWRIGSAIVVRRGSEIGEDRSSDWHANSITGFWLIGMVIVAAFWLAAPFLGVAEQLLAVLIVQLPMTASALGTVKRPEHGVRSLAGTVVPMIIPTGVVAYFLVHGSRYAVPVSLLLIFYCGIQLLLRELFQSALTRAWRGETAAAAQRDARTQFLAAASHDLGQPLHSARLFVDQAVRGVDPGRRAIAAAHAEEAFDTIERQLDHMNSYLRLEAGGIAPRLSAFAIGPLLAAAATRAMAAGRARGLIVKVVDTSLRVRADAGLLERALTNLVENAVNHAQASRLLIGARRRGDRVRLWVIDDGIGIDAAHIPALFDDYTRGSGRGGEQRGGLGLGLASVQRIAALIGASAGIDTRWRRGAAFFIDLTAETFLIAE